MLWDMTSKSFTAYVNDSIFHHEVIEMRRKLFVCLIAISSTIWCGPRLRRWHCTRTALWERLCLNVTTVDVAMSSYWALSLQRQTQWLCFCVVTHAPTCPAWKIWIGKYLLLFFFSFCRLPFFPALFTCLLVPRCASPGGDICIPAVWDLSKQDIPIKYKEENKMPK